MTATPDGANYRATYRNGSGFRTVYLEAYSSAGDGVTGRDTDGKRHLWTPGANVHIEEL